MDSLAQPKQRKEDMTFAKLMSEACIGQVH